jgi:hypothetical protein
MRLIATAPGQARIPEQLPAVPPVDHRYTPPGRRRLPGSFVWLLILAGSIAGTMWMAATPPATNCAPTPKLSQCTLQKVYLAQGTKIVAGAAGGLAIALLMEGVAGAAAPAPRRRTAGAAAAAPRRRTAGAAAAAPRRRTPGATPQPQPKRQAASTRAKPMRAPQAWGEIPTVKPKRPRVQLGEPAKPRPALAPGAVATRMPVPTTFPRSGRFARPVGVPSAMDLSSLPPALRNAVSAPPILDPRHRP